MDEVALLNYGGLTETELEELRAMTAHRAAGELQAARRAHGRHERHVRRR